MPAFFSLSMFRLCLLWGMLFAIGNSAWAATLHIKGVDNDLQENIVAHVGTISPKDFAAPVRLQRHVQLNGQAALRAMGYYDARLTIEVDEKSINLYVDAGKPLHFVNSDIHIQGAANEFPDVMKVLQVRPFTSGEVLQHSLYEALKKTLLADLLRMGFLDAVYLRSELQLDVKLKTAKVILELDSGKRYRIGHTQFNGSRIDLALLQRLSPLEQGAYFDADNVTKLRRNLLDSKYFQSVVIQQTRQSDDRIDFNIQLKDSLNHRYEVGVGYSTNTRMRLRFSWRQPQLNSHGHTAEIETRLSTPEQQLQASYTIPLKQPLTHFLRFEAGWLRKDNEDTKSNKNTLAALISKLHKTSWRTDYSLSLENEDFEQGSQKTKVLYLLPGFIISRTLLPETTDPLTGSRYWLNAQASGEALGADTDFIKLHGQAKWLFDLGNNNTVLTTRIEAGGITTDDIYGIPASLRFFTGGDQTVRGYSFESLAPVDQNGELIGGRYLNTFSLELSHRVLDDWRAAVFADTGRAYNENKHPFSTGVGFGAHWLSPIGQVRLDIAFPLDDEENDYRLHIFMGTAL